MTKEASFGVRRLRQAITNQATCGSGKFELSIDNADRLCRECEDELARLAWARGVPVPRDADGNVVPLDTAVLYTDKAVLYTDKGEMYTDKGVLYTDKGEMIYVGSIIFNRCSWYVRSTNTGKTYHLDKLYRTERDAKGAGRG